MKKKTDLRYSSLWARHHRISRNVFPCRCPILRRHFFTEPRGLSEKMSPAGRDRQTILLEDSTHLMEIFSRVDTIKERAANIPSEWVVTMSGFAKDFFKGRAAGLWRAGALGDWSLVSGPLAGWSLVSDFLGGWSLAGWSSWRLVSCFCASGWLV